MRTLLPLSDREPWSVLGTGRTDDGPLDDVMIAVDRGPRASRFSIRTMRRTGTRLGPRGSVHGTVTDAVATADLAVGCLLLEVMPAGLHERATRAAMEEAQARATLLARDRDGWDVTALPLDGIDYALFTRSIPEGTVAHADLGWATVAMWSAGPLHEGPFRLADVGPGTDPGVR
jgi:hypothetical protein